MSATEIRKGHTVILPSGDQARIQRVARVGNFVEIIFPHPFNGHRFISIDTTIEKVG